ncbi:MAG: large conductance mechanosensitive channel protein MscL [Bacteroidia bacterium]|nr:large conductance mechanosensitive channel protein MscL [Bacteroidia bacterium]
MIRGFRDFIMRGNVIDLAVAVVIGSAFGAVVNSLVKDVLTPLIGALGNIPDFSALQVGPIAIGNFINAVVNFLFVAAAIYLLVVVPMREMQNRLRKKEESTPVSPSEEVRLLQEILEELRKRNSP